ncbi:hypothetical protein NDU88_005894 [Pleurodeles waltl]|uniref:Uncharacterized protein n=1 Tax=Pleurodeles waltl TaxID=8319 RepID=A0AAV7PK65_PLEWA|nr:hypothetical protein NDU88_005894 [Pleurodeles waltl]
MGPLSTLRDPKGRQRGHPAQIRDAWPRKTLPEDLECEEEDLGLLMRSHDLLDRDHDLLGVAPTVVDCWAAMSFRDCSLKAFGAMAWQSEHDFESWSRSRHQRHTWWGSITDKTRCKALHGLNPVFLNVILHRLQKDSTKGSNKACHKRQRVARFQSCP